MKLVGSGPKMGEWNVERSPAMSWSDGNVWTASVSLDVGDEVSYKVIKALNASCSLFIAQNAPCAASEGVAAAPDRKAATPSERGLALPLLAAARSLSPASLAAE